MQPIPSTAEIILFKMLNYSVDEVWVNWAVDMLMAGFDTEHLIELAGISFFTNQFELTALTDKVFVELSLDYSDMDKAIKNYVSYLISECLAQQRDPFKILGQITNTYNATDYDRCLRDFYMLYWAKQDLLREENQWYWPDADRSNIDRIIMDYFTKWLSDNPLMFKPVLTSNL